MDDKTSNRLRYEELRSLKDKCEQFRRLSIMIIYETQVTYNSESQKANLETIVISRAWIFTEGGAVLFWTLS